MTLAKFYSQYAPRPGRLPRIRTLILTSLIVSVIILRNNILTLYYITQTFFVWNQFQPFIIDAKDHFDSSMSSYPLNKTSAEPEYRDVVPAILHHIVIGDVNLNERPTWIAARDACLKWHPNYEYRFWNDSSAEQLIKDEYPWFLETWNTYTYPIQRADSLRYLVLYRYGGIFLDMDLHCRRSLGPLRRFDFVSPSAYPVGISNGFLMTSARHPFFKTLVEQLPLFNRNFLLPYATVMFSTGCMYISAQYSLLCHQYNLRILDYEQHRLSGHILTPLFQHYGSSSWHSSDAGFIKTANQTIRFVYFYLYEIILVSCLVMMLIIFSIRRRKLKKRETNDESLLTA